MDESIAFGVSMRGWLTFLLTLTVCGIAIFEPDMRKVLEFGFSTAAGYYFGQKSQQTNQQQK